MERKEAIEVIKKNWPDSSFTMLREALETLIPELKESEDERTWIINYLSNRILNSTIIEEKENLKKAVAWLEKQGGQKSVPKFKVGDTIDKKHNSNINDFGSFTITDITGGKYWYNDRIICDITEQDEWELVEQKSAWSEEDERHKNTIIRAIHGAGNITPIDGELAEKWLKSLRGRFTWKPSEAQMDAIDYVKNFDYGGYKDMLVSLYYDLKKLKDE